MGIQTSTISARRRRAIPSRSARLFFKVDDTNRREYETAGFKPYADRAMTMPYYNVPIVVLEDAAMLDHWAARAVAVAKAARTATATKTRASARIAKPAKTRKRVRR